MADLIDRAALLAEMRRSGRAAYMLVQEAPAVDAVGCSKVEPCEYCDGNEKPFFAVEHDGSTYATRAGIWFSNGKAYLGDSDGCDFLIKYCPMCGRRLEGCQCRSRLK